MTIARTSLGEIRGSDDGGVLSFKGVPFAAPPLGALRFAPPSPPERWTGVKDALAYRPAPMQAE